MDANIKIIFLHIVYRDILVMDFQNNFVKCRVQILGKCDSIRITGSILNSNNFKNAMVLAPNPINKNASYSGTGLPFPCADIAFEETPNMKEIDLSQEAGSFDVKFSYPNSYYTVANKKKIISSIFFILDKIEGGKEFIRFELKDMYPLRSLVNRESRTGPEFYSDKYDILPVDTANAIMKAYAKIKVSNDIA